MFDVLDLFSGIGGFSLGLERTGGFRTIAFCEIEAYCRAVLKKHWPKVPIFNDITTLTRQVLADNGLAPRVLCGGFPCQDISTAGKGAGIAGERSGLWKEYSRLVGEIRPEYIIVENVSALLNRGLDRVLGDLAALGYDAEWHCIPASAVGAPHRRDRIWIVAYPQSERYRERREQRNVHEESGRQNRSSSARVSSTSKQPKNVASSLADATSTRATGYTSRTKTSHTMSGNSREDVADANSNPRNKRRKGDTRKIERGGNVDRGGEQENDVSDTNDTRSRTSKYDRKGWSKISQIGANAQHRFSGYGEITSDSDRQQKGRLAIAWSQCDQWLIEPNVGRVADGVPSRVDRLSALGNAVVPQIPEIIGQAILEWEKNNA